MSNNIISIKAFSEKNHISEQAVYKKICRNSDRLKSHISKQNSKMMLDNFAQELLKPADINFILAEKVKQLENLLEELLTVLSENTNSSMGKKLGNLFAVKRFQINDLSKIYSDTTITNKIDFLER